MKKLVKYLFYTFIGVFIFVVPSSGQNDDNFKYKHVKRYNLSRRLLKDWHKDQKGCLCLRIKYTKEIVDNKFLVGVPKKTIYEIFGLPNSLEGAGYLVYNLASHCDVNHNIIKDTDGSFLTFIFLNDKLERCVMQVQ